MSNTPIGVIAAPGSGDADMAGADPGAGVEEEDDDAAGDASKDKDLKMATAGWTAVSEPLTRSWESYGGFLESSKFVCTTNIIASCDKFEHKSDLT